MFLPFHLRPSPQFAFRPLAILVANRMSPVSTYIAVGFLQYVDFDFKIKQSNFNCAASTR